jgi:phosphopantetheine adenylyltransferase
MDAVSIPRPKELDCPSLPATFLRRERYFDRIFQNIANDVLSFCLVTGPSGSGKTSTVADLYIHLLSSGEYIGTWIDCRQIVDSETKIALQQGVTRKNLIVLDFLNDDNHPLLTHGFIERYQSDTRIVVITTSDSVVRKVMQIRGIADRKADVIVELQNFSPEETAFLLKRASGAELSSKEVDVLAAHTCGYPQFCQMVNDIIVSEGCDCSDILHSDVHANSAENLAHIFTYWLSSCLMSAPAESIIKCYFTFRSLG